MKSSTIYHYSMSSSFKVHIERQHRIHAFQCMKPRTTHFIQHALHSGTLSRAHFNIYLGPHNSWPEGNILLFFLNIPFKQCQFLELAEKPLKN